eukprot:11909097-Karenia_brevis.AAC.1
MVLLISGSLRQEPSIGALACMAQPSGPKVMPNAQDRARQDILTYLAAGGQAALQELAAASGRTEMEFLRAVVGSGTGQPSSQIRGRVLDNGPPHIATPVYSL